jgi:hypothetical protein
VSLNLTTVLAVVQFRVVQELASQGSQLREMIILDPDEAAEFDSGQYVINPEPHKKTTAGRIQAVFNQVAEACNYKLADIARLKKTRAPASFLAIRMKPAGGFRFLSRAFNGHVFTVGTPQHRLLDTFTAQRAMTLF